MLRNGWKCIVNCVTWFLALFNKVEKCLCIRFVCLSVRPSVHALTVVNILQISLHMLFISDIEGTVLKMIRMRLSVLLQTQKFSDTFRPIRTQDHTKDF